MNLASINSPKEVYRTHPEELDRQIKTSFSLICDADPNQKIVYFKDSVSGEHLSFENTKTCIIEQDPMSKQGLEVLERLGADALDITFLFGHHNSPEDFYDLFKNPAVRISLERSAFIAIEANASPTGEGILVEPRGAGRGQFQQTQMKWLQSHNKLALPCDIDTPLDPTISGGTLRQTMMDIWELNDLIGKSSIPPREQKRLSTIKTLYYHLIREEMMLGQLGYWVYELEKHGALASSEKTSIPFMLGSFHRPIVEKAAIYLGASPKTFDTQPLSEHAELFTQIARQGYAHYDQLDRFAAL